MQERARTELASRQRPVSQFRARRGGGARPAVAGLVLAGGRGSRMGGRDKGLVRSHGELLAAQAMAVLAPWCDFRVISANRNLARYRRLADVVVVDRNPGFLGPLAGMAAALQVVTAPCWLVCPCDVTGLPREVPRRLLRALRLNAGTDVAVLRDGERLQPLVAALRGHLAPAMHDYLRNGGRSMHGWLECRKVAVVQVSTVIGNRNARV